MTRAEWIVMCRDCAALTDSWKALVNKMNLRRVVADIPCLTLSDRGDTGTHARTLLLIVQDTKSGG